VVSRIMRTGTSLSRPVAVLLREIAAELITQKSTHFASTSAQALLACIDGRLQDPQLCPADVAGESGESRYLDHRRPG